MRVLGIVSLVLVLGPAVASGQSSAPSITIQAAAGPTLVDRGHVVSAAIGFAPLSRVTLFLDVQRAQLSSRITRHERGSSAFRGGTLTAVSGDLRVGLWPADRVTPYGVAGFGAGVSRPTVNETFPDRVTHDARFVSLGGGLHVPLRNRLSLFSEARWLIGVDGGGGLLAMVPVRVGVGWRF